MSITTAVNERTVDFAAFMAAVVAADGLGRELDEQQTAAVAAPPDQPLFLVAGPGSGKTTVLTLRILKLILVDGFPPASIVATTFTRKAAAELRARILGWGNTLRDLVLPPTGRLNPLDDPHRVDFNLVVTGTLDSLAQTILTDFRPVGAKPPVALDEFVTDSYLYRYGLLPADRLRDDALLACARRLDGRPNLGRDDLVGLCAEVRERFLHDMVDVDAYLEEAAKADPGVELMCAAIADYAAALDCAPRTDYAGLEDVLRQRIERGELRRFVSGVRAVLVDEYQDTNLLQEAIYFGLARHAIAAGGSIVVVGDDDQALYRFRGATVELFRDFPARLSKRNGARAQTIYLVRNYRSTPAIVRWCSAFAELDPRYQDVRVAGKPSLVPARKNAGPLPVMGMFRPNLAQLARDLAALIGGVFHGSGVEVRTGDGKAALVRHADGVVGDCAVLLGSPKERTGTGSFLLPGLLARALDGLPTPIQVHNPRGVEFHALPGVPELCGLMLECIDPDAMIQRGQKFPGKVGTVFWSWREAARRYIDADPSPAFGTGAGSLRAFVAAWQRRVPQAPGRAWPKEAPLNALLYQLVAWMPRFQTDPLALAHLEVIGRATAQAAQFNVHNGMIERDPPWAERSVRSALWVVFKPLAEGEVDPDEGLVGSLPRDKVNLLSIHQAKGLEFPFVVVDVGSRFENAAAWSQFLRFPSRGSRAHNLEDAFRPYSPLGPPTRHPIDRAFDDLVRQYFVAFSRAQDALLLVGIGDAATGPRKIPNVAVGWTREGRWPWHDHPDLVLI